MWQVLLAAAVTGSGILAKKLIINSNATETLRDSKQNGQNCDEFNDQAGVNKSLQPQESIFLGNEGLQKDGNEAHSEALGDGSIFRFSSTSGDEKGSRNLRKKTGVGSRGAGGNMEGFKKNSNGKVAKKCGILGCEKRGWVVDQRGSGNGKRFSVCLKKRRTSKNASGKCESCTSKGNSLFSWGLGVGIMYMMSAGKVEISRLNNAMDETSKVVQELKGELSRRKTFHDLSNSTTEIETELMNNRGGHAHPVFMKSSSEKADDLKVYDLLTALEGECASSVLTEEQQPEVMEMDQLEAELETELQKLPWCAIESSGFEERRDASETEVSGRQFHPADDQISDSQQFNGVLPSELDKKLCHLLIGQQESQIVELESELHRTHSKLHEKETELQVLKDCVRRLTEFSLGSASDEETEVVSKEMQQAKDIGPESSKSTVGMKRTMDCLGR